MKDHDSVVRRFKPPQVLRGKSRRPRPVEPSEVLSSHPSARSQAGYDGRIFDAVAQSGRFPPTPPQSAYPAELVEKSARPTLQ